jgi:two-component system sensor histidine kinase UhpB
VRASARAPLRVLLVEDNPGDAGLIADLLDVEGGEAHSHEHVPDLARARQRLPAETFDVVLLDLNLPDGFGVDCVKEVRALARTVPIVVLTGMEDDELALACVAAGAQDYLAKNELRPQTLRRAIGYAIARTRESAERQRADALQARLAAIVESSYDAIVSSSVGGVITSWNRGAERIFGFTAAEAVGRHVREILRPQADEAGWLDERRVFQVQRGVGAGGVAEVVRFHKDGRLLNLSVVTSVIQDTAGGEQALAAILRDVTENKRRDAELQRLVNQQAARELRMTALTSRLRNLQEEERTRISREVHDGLGQLLTGLKMDIRWLMRRAGALAGATAMSAKLAQADALVDQTIQTVQRIAVELRPSALDALGLPSALRDEARRFEARAGVQAVVQVQSHIAPKPAVATALFRIFQELLTNVARHARARRVQIALSDDGANWTLEVRDDGVGLPDDLPTRGASLGLLGMTERAESLGGSFQLESVPGGGALGCVTVPKFRP